eukprot:1016144-Pyramimonas_sp.AAC.1
MPWVEVKGGWYGAAWAHKAWCLIYLHALPEQAQRELQLSSVADQLREPNGFKALEHVNGRTD